jgi:hypothetical protein
MVSHGRSLSLACGRTGFGGFAVYIFHHEEHLRWGLRSPYSIIQAEHVVPFTPQLTDVSFALDDEGLDSEILGSRGELEPRLATPTKIMASC